MGSGASFNDYEQTRASSRRIASDDEEERARAEAERKQRLEDARRAAAAGTAKAPKVRQAAKVYDPGAVKLGITSPPAKAEDLYIVLVDNSASNHVIAEHTRDASAHILSMLGIIDPKAAMAIIYFSDHCDGNNLMQAVDYVSPTQAGDRQLLSSVTHVAQADGGDEPEAIECALWSACEIGFGKVPKANRHLYLVTDVVAHGMGMDRDGGCPAHRDWQESLARVRQTYGSFEVIGCGQSTVTAELQTKFIPRDRLAYDLIALSEIRSDEHRKRITANALLFLIARSNGVQNVQTFLMALYEKWIAEPIFGTKTDMNARLAIARFVKYLELDDTEKQALMARIFA
jgi:hypothetical protein